MKTLQTLTTAIIFGLFAFSCQLMDEVEEIFPGFVLEEGKLYEVSGKAPYSGKVTNYFDDGSLKMEGYYEEGVQKLVIHYYQNGNKRSKIDRTGEADEMTTWFESGQKQEEFLPGLIREWYENGQLKAEVRLDDFKNYHGDMKMWDEDGNLVTHEIYENGELVKRWNIE
jgi:antitoxin component YwqK of YwqJK toxin-antitoxin module